MSEKITEQNEVSVTLNVQQWTIVMDWIAHNPYQEARDIIVAITEQMKGHETETKTFTCKLPIKTYNIIIYTLTLAPYYIVAEIIQTIHAQCNREIEKLGEELAAAEKQTEENTTKAQ